MQCLAFVDTKTLSLWCFCSSARLLKRHRNVYHLHSAFRISELTSHIQVTVVSSCSLCLFQLDSVMTIPPDHVCCYVSLSSHCHLCCQGPLELSQMTEVTLLWSTKLALWAHVLHLRTYAKWRPILLLVERKKRKCARYLNLFYWRKRQTRLTSPGAATKFTLFLRRVYKIR